MNPKDRIIVALDVSDVTRATTLAEDLAPYVGAFKLGLEFITATFPQLIAVSEKQAIKNLFALRNLFAVLDDRIFWDGKFDDIPNTVAGASQAAVALNVKAFNVHASAGRKSVEAAVANRGSADVYGVTVLTSIDEEECVSIFGDVPDRKVLEFGWLLFEAGAQGIICSPKEAELLRTVSEFSGIEVVTPGVRPLWAAVGDQKRVLTPQDAIRAGVTRLVIGRPISNPPAEIGTPVDAVLRIAEEIASVS